MPVFMEMCHAGPDEENIQIQVQEISYVDKIFVEMIAELRAVFSWRELVCWYLAAEGSRVARQVVSNLNLRAMGEVSF